MPYYSAIARGRSDLGDTAVLVVSGTAYKIANKDLASLRTADLRAFDGSRARAEEIASSAVILAGLYDLPDPRMGPDERLLSGEEGDLPADPCVDLPATTTTTTAPAEQNFSYAVEGTGAATVTYTVGPSGSTQQEDVTLPWRKDFVFGPPEGFGSIVAQIKGTGTVTCRILKANVQVASSTSNGQYVVVTCAEP